MKNERNAAPIRTRQREKITALPAVFFNKGKEVRPNRQSLFFGVLGNQIPFRAVKRDAAPDALIVNGGSACIGAFAAPVPLAHCFPARSIASITVLAIKHIAAIVRHFIRKAINFSFVILNSFKNSSIFKRRELFRKVPALCCYLIDVIINTINVPIAASASKRLDTAFIQSVTGMRCRLFFFLATHYHLLWFNLDFIISIFQKYVKRFSQFFSGVLKRKNRRHILIKQFIYCNIIIYTNKRSRNYV